MKHEDENSSSEEQGFYKPHQIKVEVELEEDQGILVQNNHEQPWEANQLIQHGRPIDYLPRVLTSTHPLLPHQQQLNGSQSSVREELIPLRNERTKKSKYLTLKDKYQDSSQYSLVYSKLQASDEPSCTRFAMIAYIFSLNQTTDYNPKDYQTAQESIPLNQNKFQSRFESGNLLLAYRCLRSEIQQYDLILQNDTNTRGYNNWFYFLFQNHKSRQVRFNLVNLIKRHCLFEDGVRPVGFSLAAREKGWHPIGTDIEYQKSYITREIQTNPPTYKSFYTLSFTLNFQQEDDKYCIAMNYPYTYSKMVQFIDGLTSKSNDIKIQKQILGYTISNNPIVILRMKHSNYEQGGKKIVVMGRQHPGETVGSYTLQGFLNKIANQQDILKHYQLIAIPMVNPDGVIYGNFRTNLAGFDLNRQWLEPDRWMHPQIYIISKFINSLLGIHFALDFHGHSKKYNSFIYACNGDPAYPYRIFPYIFSKNSPFFSIQDCTYSITADKQRTARIQIYRSINRPQVFTLETSFFGYSDANGRKFRYSIKDLLRIGEDAVQSLKIYLLRKKDLLAVEKEVKEKQHLFQQWSCQIRKDEIESESNPSEDELTPFERKEKVIATKTARRFKPKSKSKKKSKKKRQSSIINLTALKKMNDQKCQLSLDKELKSPLRKQVTTGPLVISQKKIESEKIIQLNQTKIKPKKVQKIISIISPHPPKPLTKPKAPSFTQKQANSDVKLRLQFEKLNNRQTKPTQKMQGGQMIQTITSNLFNKPNYFSYFQQKMFKRQVQSTPSHNKTQSLEINSIKRQNTFSHGATMDVLRKLISGEDEEKKETHVEQVKRNRDKMYMLRENRIISTTARMNQEAMKRNIQEEIANRTLALKNCQKKMHEITLDDPIIRSETDSYAIQYLNSQLRQTCSVKAPKFPAIKSEKKRDYFNF